MKHKNSIRLDSTPRGVMVKANRNKRVRTPVVLLRSLSSKYPWVKYEPLYPPSSGLNRRMALTLNNLRRLYAIKQKNKTIRV